MTKERKCITSNLQDLNKMGLPYLLPPEKRELATVIIRLCSDERFREKFWQDPAGALVEAGICVDPSTVNLVINIDQAIIDNFVRESQDILARSQGFTWEGEQLMAIPALAAAALAGAAVGALVTEYLHHHLRDTHPPR